MIKNIKTSLLALPLLLLGACEEDVETYSNANPVAEYGEQVNFALTSTTLGWKSGDGVGISLVGDDYSQNTKWLLDDDLTTLYPNTEQSKIFIESETLSSAVEYLVYYPFQYLDEETGLVTLDIESQVDLIYAKTSSATTAVSVPDEFTSCMTTVNLNYAMIAGQGNLPTNLTATLSNIYATSSFDPTTGAMSGASGAADGVYSNISVSASNSSVVTLFPQADLSNVTIDLYNAYGERYIGTFIEDDMSSECWESGEEYTYTIQVENEPSAVISASLNYSTLGVVVDSTLPITITLDEGTLYDSIDWVSSSANATVAWDGLNCTVTGVTAGTATLTMTLISTNDDANEEEGTAATTNTIVKELTVTVTDGVVLVNDIELTVVGDNAASTTTILGVGQSLSLSAAITPTTATDPSCSWSVTAGGDLVEVDATTGLVTAKAEGTATIQVKANDSGAETATLSVTVIDLGTIEAGYYYYTKSNSSRFIYSAMSERSTIEEAGYTVAGIVYSVDATTGTAMAMHIESPYKAVYAASNTTYASEQLPNTVTTCGRTNMDAAYRVTTNFTNLTAFKYVDALNGTNGSTSYDSYTMNTWYIPANTELAVLCKWLYSIGGDDIADLNNMLTTAGRSSSTASFLAFVSGTNNIRLWTSYDSGNTSGTKVSVYCPSSATNGYTTTTMLKTKSMGHVTPILQFYY